MIEIWKEPAEIVGITQEGVSVGLSGQRTVPGFVLENGTALLECEKDINGFYIGGAGMNGMYLKTPERYEAVRDEAGQLTGFRSVSKYVTAFSGEELELIYSYAQSPEEDLAAELNTVAQHLRKAPEIRALYARTAEKLGQVPLGERRKLVADVYAVWKERHLQGLIDRQQAVQRASVRPSIYEHSGDLLGDLMDTSDLDIPSGEPVKLPIRDDFLDDLWDFEEERYETARLAARGKEPDQRPSMQVQLDSAARESEQRNAERGAARTSALEAER